MSMTWMGVLIAALLVATGTIVLVAARLLQALRTILHLEQQVTRLQEGTNLLTDTVELGFRQVAAELERIAEIVSAGRAPAVRTQAARPTTARVKAASARGRSVREIAAAEQVSEGEVRLRLSLADAGAKARPTPAKPATTPARRRKSRFTTTTEQTDAALRA